MIRVTFNTDGKEERIELPENEALTLLKYLYANIQCDNVFPKFEYESPIDGIKPWEIGLAYIPEGIRTSKFWEKSNGREIADRYGIKEVARYYLFLLGDYFSLERELRMNKYWKINRDNYNIEIARDTADAILKEY